MMDELVVISGKGGTGKTSVTASLAVLAGQSVLADCDVDAADLHLLLTPRIRERHDFFSGHQAVIRQKECIGCGACLAYCRFEAVQRHTRRDDPTLFTIDSALCEGCGVCVHFCPVKAIDFNESLCGEWMISTTRCGPMVHARLGLAAENSGKLVSMVREEARRLAEREGLARIIVDGPPGIGCPVISSLTGASRVLLVSEPTVSGEHDLQRVLQLTRHFKIPTAVCVNKFDIDIAMTERIERDAVAAGARVLGRIHYDPMVTRTQIQKKAVVETESIAADDIREVWKQLYSEE
jgi:MinD superfamily P-loop ATPase